MSFSGTHYHLKIIELPDRVYRRQRAKEDMPWYF
jgi:hypothetical protein